MIQYTILCTFVKPRRVLCMDKPAPPGYNGADVFLPAPRRRISEPQRSLYHGTCGRRGRNLQPKRTACPMHQSSAGPAKRCVRHSHCGQCQHRRNRRLPGRPERAAGAQPQHRGQPRRGRRLQLRDALGRGGRVRSGVDHGRRYPAPPGQSGPATGRPYHFGRELRFSLQRRAVDGRHRVQDEPAEDQEELLRARGVAAPRADSGGAGHLCVAAVPRRRH